MLNQTYEALAFDYMQRWGNHASIPLIERSCTLYTHDTIQGLIGYHQRKSSVIIFGDPLCDDADKDNFVKAFHAQCNNRGLAATYLNASEQFTRWFIEKHGGSCMSMGNELIINPKRNLRKETGFYARDLRWKHNKSVREGISVHEYTGNDPELERAIQEVGDAWLSNRSGRQARLFLLNIFNNRKGKRWFYAQQKSKIVGVLTLNQLPAQHGWLINNLMCIPGAVNSTSAFMMMHAFDVLSSEGCEFFSAGFIPEHSLNNVQGFSKINTWIMHKTYGICNKILKLHSKKQFWNQFQPTAQPTYLLCASPWSMSNFAALMQSLHVI